eukprot:CAMPEP_0197676780 /NCGR_PEP_ID=MMETSP1338-20131121/87346_1 /TAXON_ID=43686 ORGANISM="Pelagodinium beii, Strain RCC1491" /NCGR_SAMPLE_ID=MMETSP1338 /ASSEMBLY_ACC=CAM_ASM_000754 /LENGTH=64 /DNA_ID=CAMNT_0043257505 /DNA_START=368 /DNA_END=559 /DNA_ORIENTATION=+
MTTKNSLTASVHTVTNSKILREVSDLNAMQPSSTPSWNSVVSIISKTNKRYPSAYLRQPDRHLA